MTGTTTSPTQELITLLLNEGVLTGPDAVWALKDYLGEHQTAKVVCDQIDAHALLEEFSNAAGAWEQRWRDMEAVRERRRAAGDLSEEEKFLIELEEMDGRDDSVWVAIPTPAGAVLQGMIDRGVPSGEVQRFVNSFLGDRELLRVLCRGVDAAGLTDDFAAKTRLGRYRHSPSLRTLIGQTRRGDLELREARKLAVAFAERCEEHGLVRMLCRHIEAAGRTSRLRERCEGLLREGIPLDAHEYLEAREWMTRQDVEYFNELQYDDYYGDHDDPRDDNADPAIDQPWLGTKLARLPHQVEWRETLDGLDLAEPTNSLLDEQTIEYRRPGRDVPPHLEGATPLECLLAVEDAGVLSAAAVRGVAVQTVESYEGPCLLDVLCRHFDAAGLGKRFSRFLKDALDEDAKPGRDWRRQGF